MTLGIEAADAALTSCHVRSMDEVVVILICGNIFEKIHQ